MAACKFPRKFRVSQQVLDMNLAKNHKRRKTRESLFTFWLSSADLPSIWRVFIISWILSFQSYAKLLLIACIVASINPFASFGFDTPGPFAWALENKLYAAMMIFFISNAIETQLVSTGAFEITVDNMPVWSKIDSGRIPQPPELFQIIDTHIKLNSGQDSIPMEQL